MFSWRPRTRDNNRIPDINACFAVSVGVHPFALPVALLCAVVLLCLLHGCAGVPTSLNSVATSFEASCERLPCGVPSTECFVWSLHVPFFSLSHCLSSQARPTSARGLQHWTWRLQYCFEEAAHQHVLDRTVWTVLWISLGIFWIICTCLCVCAFFTMF